jgi:hypothetical protein
MKFIIIYLIIIYIIPIKFNHKDKSNINNSIKGPVLDKAIKDMIENDKTVEESLDKDNIVHTFDADQIVKDQS